MDKIEKLELKLEETHKKLFTKVYKLADARKEIHQLKMELADTRRQLVGTTDRLKTAEETIRMQKAATDQTVATLRDHLFSWLTPENQFRVKRMLRFYNKEQQVRMMTGLLNYLVFGIRPRFPREVERWHFRLIVEQIDADMIALPAHSLMVKLFKKYGLLESLLTYPEASQESDFRPHGEEW